MSRVTIAFMAAVFALIVTGCNPFSGPLPGNPAQEPYFIQHLEGEGRYPLEIDLGAASRNVYLTFVNPDSVDATGDVIVSGDAVESTPVESVRMDRAASPIAAGRRAPTPAKIAEFNQNPFGGRGRGAPSLRLFERLPGAPLLDIADVSTGTFFNDELTSVAATCRAVVGPVDLGDGQARTLNIWVADNCWYIGGTKPEKVTPDMVTAMVDKFLKTGSLNDIYDWVSAMLGPEWGPHPYSDLIAPDDEITIFLCDISDDSSTTGGIVGYFWSKDNLVKGSDPAYLDYYSSERIMFTIDAVMYAIKDGGTWDSTDSWPEEIYSTLAHEFQHMIHFYQRAVLRDAMATGDTWINEMASQVVEDLLADKMGVIGPRGVDGADGTDGTAGNTAGRLPLFNAYNDLSLSDWNNDLASYSITYAFGAWLARNYGGAKLLNRLMQCASTGPASIEDIVSLETGRSESFSRLLQRWSAAQLLSDATDPSAGYRYNAGAFFDSTVDGNAYRLGSINLYNYTPAPYLYTRSTVGSYQPLSTSQALCQGAIPGTGVLAWTLDMPDGVIASVVVK